MKTNLLLAIAIAVLTAVPSLAQPRVSLSASAAYVAGSLTHTRGAAVDVAANVRWGRLLVGLHAAELTYTRVHIGQEVEDPVTGEVRSVSRLEPDFDYSVVLDASYVQPVAESVALFGGLGVRFQQGDDIPPPRGNSGFALQVPHLQVGALLGRTDAVHTVVRVLTRRGVEQVQVGIAFPLRF